jgi:anthranilate synthase/aminodeoxychorismate synthase-like glutamine amidotransferase
MKTLDRNGQRFEPATTRTRPGTDEPTRVLVIDNYDSFTFNLVQYLLELGAVVDVYRNDVLSAQDVLDDDPSHVLLSPGPGRPTDSGVCQELCRVLCDPPGDPIPLLGVCLGHQTLCEVHGADVVVADRIMHGKVSAVVHDQTGILARVPSPFSATRYHSLIVREPTLPDFLLPTARTPERELMAVRHATLPVFGVQFHPESILSEHGHQMLDAFLHQGTRR